MRSDTLRTGRGMSAITIAMAALALSAAPDRVAGQSVIGVRVRGVTRDQVMITRADGRSFRATAVGCAEDRTARSGVIVSDGGFSLSQSRLVLVPTGRSCSIREPAPVDAATQAGSMRTAPTAAIGPAIPICGVRLPLSSVNDRALVLRDGTRWKIDAAGGVLVSQWHTSDDVVVCDDRHIVNIRTGQAVQVTRGL